MKTRPTPKCPALGKIKITKKSDNRPLSESARSGRHPLTTLKRSIISSSSGKEIYNSSDKREVETMGPMGMQSCARNFGMCFCRTTCVLTCDLAAHELGPFTSKRVGGKNVLPARDLCLRVGTVSAVSINQSEVVQSPPLQVNSKYSLKMLSIFRGLKDFKMFFCTAPNTCFGKKEHVNMF